LNIFTLQSRRENYDAKRVNHLFFLSPFDFLLFVVLVNTQDSVEVQLQLLVGSSRLVQLLAQKTIYVSQVGAPTETQQTLVAQDTICIIYVVEKEFHDVTFVNALRQSFTKNTSSYL
jgi:hypothetical protein